jgi:hypothetical protein
MTSDIKKDDNKTYDASLSNREEKIQNHFERFVSSRNF